MEPLIAPLAHAHLEVDGPPWSGAAEPSAAMERAGLYFIVNFHAIFMGACWLRDAAAGSDAGDSLPGISSMKGIAGAAVRCCMRDETACRRDLPT